MTKDFPYAAGRIPVGIWAQWPDGARWSNEGMTRLLGFLIEGIATGREYIFRIVVPDKIRRAAAEDLAALNATEGLDYTIHSPSDHHIDAASIEEFADFANLHVEVAGWLSIFPTFTAGLLLNQPVTTIFPDAIPTVFHEFSDLAWGPNGNHAVWRDLVSTMLIGVERVVTFSQHVAKRQAHDLFGVPMAKIRVVPHACPDLRADLPFMKGRRKTITSVARAAQILREFCRERGVHYLTDFPFESVTFIAVSTQDRVTKNLRVLALALQHLLRTERLPVKVVTTAPLHYGATWTPLPGLIENQQSQFDFLSLPDMPRDVHAAFYHCATVAVHPSIFEGGHAPFPFYEAVSVGTPCIMANGPHIEEIGKQYPDLKRYVFDPNDQVKLVDLIRAIIKNPDEAIQSQSLVYRGMSERQWSAVAAGYARAATEQLN